VHHIKAKLNHALKTGVHKQSVAAFW